MQLFGSKKNGKHSGNISDDTDNTEYQESTVEIVTEETAAEPETDAEVVVELQSISSAQQTEATDSAQQGRKADFDEVFGDKQQGQPKKAEEIVRERQKKKKKKKVWKILLIILLVLACLAGGVYIYIEYFTSPPPVDNTGISNYPNTPENRKEGVFTFLVAGVDQISNNTDTIMIGSFDIPNHKLNIVSIPRDTLINLRHEYKKANSAYHYAQYYSGVEGSSYYGIDPVESMRQELVQNMLGFNVDCYVLVNLKACADVVDTIGGVEFDVPMNMNYDSNNQNLHIHINKGMQTLNGEQFVQVMRFRSGYTDADLGRIKTQQKLLKALADQMLTLKNIPNLPEAAQIVADNMQTNMTVDNMIYFAKEFLKLEKSDINFYTMPKLDTGAIFGQSYVFADINAWIDMVNAYLNPYKNNITLQNINMVTYMNGHFYSTTGELNGGIESFDFYSADDPMASAEVFIFPGVEVNTTATDEGATDNDGTA